MNFLNITCPCCNTILVIDRITGKIIEERKPLLEKPTGDRFKDALIKSKKQKTEIEKKFKKSEEAHKKRAESLEQIFNKSLEKVKADGDKSKPETPFDFD